MTDRIVVRRAIRADVYTLFVWANDYLVRNNSFTPAPITFADHMEWVSSRVEAADCRIYMIEADNWPIGQVRYDRVGSATAEIDVSVASDYRCLGYGTRALCATRDLAMAALHVKQTVGIVRSNNFASYKAFTKAQFVRGPDRIEHDIPCYTFIYPR